VCVCCLADFCRKNRSYKDIYFLTMSLQAFKYGSEGKVLIFFSDRVYIYFNDGNSSFSQIREREAISSCSLFNRGMLLPNLGEAGPKKIRVPCNTCIY
jgi:hypothetical protein